MDNKKLVRAGELTQKRLALRRQADAMDEQIRGLIGQPLIAYGEADLNDGRTQITIEIAMGEYLARWPDAEPVLKTFKSGNGKQKGYMKYPVQYCGEGKGVRVYAEACTPCIELPEAKAPEAVSA